MNHPVEAAKFDIGTPHQVAGQNIRHESAHLHVTGTAPYTDDVPELAGTLHCALGLSPVAHGRLIKIDVEGLKALPGVFAILTSADVPGDNITGAIIHDEPILPTDEVSHVGQPVFAVLSTDREAARRAAARAKDFLHIEPLPAVLTPEEAHAQGSYVVPQIGRASCRERV